MNDEQFKDALAKQGMTMENYRKQVSKDIDGRCWSTRNWLTRQCHASGHRSLLQSPRRRLRSAEQVRVRDIFLPLSLSAPAEEERE